MTLNPAPRRGLARRLAVAALGTALALAAPLAAMLLVARFWLPA
jgi:hypothetical protein